MRKYKFRFRGVTRERDGEKIIFFFLDEPQILVGKEKKAIEADETSDTVAKYIPYRESDGKEKDAPASSVAYPENWRKSFGISYEIREKRSRLLDALSAQDICRSGTKVVNPFIGVIPDSRELESEVQQLYEAM